MPKHTELVTCCSDLLTQTAPCQLMRDDVFLTLFIPCACFTFAAIPAVVVVVPLLVVGGGPSFDRAVSRVLGGPMPAAVGVPSPPAPLAARMPQYAVGPHPEHPIREKFPIM